LREEGITVLGFGEKKTPMAFRNACNKFILTEVLRPSVADNADTVHKAINNNQPPVSSHPTQVSTPSTIEFPKEFILAALEQSTDDTGWAQLGTFGSYLNKLQPDFDSRIYGFKKLSDLVKAKTDLFKVEERKAPGGNSNILYIQAIN
jgi:hypothetical protein